MSDQASSSNIEANITHHKTTTVLCRYSQWKFESLEKTAATLDEKIYSIISLKRFNIYNILIAER